MSRAFISFRGSCVVALLQLLTLVTSRSQLDIRNRKGRSQRYPLLSLIHLCCHSCSCCIVDLEVSKYMEKRPGKVLQVSIGPRGVKIHEENA